MRVYFCWVNATKLWTQAIACFFDNESLLKSNDVNIMVSWVFFMVASVGSFQFLKDRRDGSHSTVKLTFDVSGVWKTIWAYIVFVQWTCEVKNVNRVWWMWCYFTNQLLINPFGCNTSTVRQHWNLIWVLKFWYWHEHSRHIHGLKLWRTRTLNHQVVQEKLCKKRI